MYDLLQKDQGGFCCFFKQEWYIFCSYRKIVAVMSAGKQGQRWRGVGRQALQPNRTLSSLFLIRRNSQHSKVDKWSVVSFPPTEINCPITLRLLYEIRDSLMFHI